MGLRSWFGRTESQTPAQVARRYGLAETDTTEERIQALADELRRLASGGPDRGRVARLYDRVLPAHLEVVHGQKRDREYRQFVDAMIHGGQEGLRMVAGIAIQQLHNEAHGLEP